MHKIYLSGALLTMAIFLVGCGAPKAVEPSESPDQSTAEQMPAGQSAIVVPVEDRCVEACENYVKQCLYLVPNADEYVFDQGRESCMEECAGWETEKVACMAEAVTCASMTDICDL